MNLPPVVTQFVLNSYRTGMPELSGGQEMLKMAGCVRLQL